MKLLKPLYQVTALFLVIFVTSLYARDWTSRERVVDAARNMQEKAQNFYSFLNRRSLSATVPEKVLMLVDKLKEFSDTVESGIPYEEAEKEFERLAGVYHHTGRAVSEAYNLNFLVMMRWRSVQWAWEPLSWNMYGTVP